MYAFKVIYEDKESCEIREEYFTINYMEFDEDEIYMSAMSHALECRNNEDINSLELIGY